MAAVAFAAGYAVKESFTGGGADGSIGRRGGHRHIAAAYRPAADHRKSVLAA